MGDSYFPFKYKHQTPAHNNALTRNVDKNYVKEKLLHEDVEFGKDLKAEKELLMNERKRKIDLLNSRAMYNNYGEWKRAHTLRSISMYRDAALYGMTPMDTKNESYFMLTAIKPLGDTKRISANDVTNATVGGNTRMSQDYHRTPEKLRLNVPGGASPNDTPLTSPPITQPKTPLLIQDKRIPGDSLKDMTPFQMKALSRLEELGSSRKRSQSVSSPPRMPPSVPKVSVKLTSDGKIKVKSDNKNASLHEGAKKGIDFGEEASPRKALINQTIKMHEDWLKEHKSNSMNDPDYIKQYFAFSRSLQDKGYPAVYGGEIYHRFNREQTVRRTTGRVRPQPSQPISVDRRSSPKKASAVQFDSPEGGGVFSSLLGSVRDRK